MHRLRSRSRERGMAQPKRLDKGDAMFSVRRFIRVGGAAILLASGVVVGALSSSPAASASGFTWSIVTTPNTTTSEINIVVGVTCMSATDCWAVGFASSGSGGTNQTLAEHWNGTAWSIVTTPNVTSSGGDVLGSVACVSSSDCWAVGSYTPQGFPVEDTQALAEHWNGTAWSIVTTPNPNPLDSKGLFGVACLSSSDCWAVGFGFIGGGGTRGTLAEHWNGSAWSIIATGDPSFANNQLSGVTCTSTSDCWAVGFALTGNFDETSQTLAEHWNGSAWSVVPTPNSSPQGNSLSGAACITTSDCWAVGAAATGSGSVAEHWNGSSWSVVPTPNSSPQANVLSGVACVDASDCWAVGTATVPSGNTSRQQTLAEHWNGTAWSIVTTPNTSSSQFNELNGVTCVSSSNCWAVGAAASGTGGSLQTLAEHGTFSPAPTTTTLTSTPAVEGQTTTLTASVKPGSGAGTPTGSVTFTDMTRGKLLGRVMLKGGFASLATVFPEEGSHSITASYGGDANFLPSSTTRSISVADAPLTGRAPPAPLQGREGVPFFAKAVPVSGVVASFTDADPAGSLSDYSATIAWGDGSTSAGVVAASGSGFTISGNHTYREDGNYPITVHIADLGGSTATVHTSAHVSEPRNFLAFLVDLFFERFGF